MVLEQRYRVGHGGGASHASSLWLLSATDVFKKIKISIESSRRDEAAPRGAMARNGRPIENAIVIERSDVLHWQAALTV